MTFRTNILPQEFLNPFHALFVLYLIQCIEDSCRGTVIGHIQFPDRSAILILRDIEDILLLHRTIIDDLLFPLCQVFERNIRAHPHLPADICHQRPHQRIPWRNGSLINGFIFIRNQCCTVNSPHHSRAAAAFARPGGIKGKLFCPRGIKMLPALRAD